MESSLRSVPLPLAGAMERRRSAGEPRAWEKARMLRRRSFLAEKRNESESPGEARIPLTAKGGREPSGTGVAASGELLGSDSRTEGPGRTRSVLGEGVWGSANQGKVPDSAGRVREAREGAVSGRPMSETSRGVPGLPPGG